MTTTTKTISRIERLKNSADGNPTYEIVWTDGTSNRTKTNAMVAYEITNPEYQGVPLRVTLEGRSVIGVEPIEG